LNSHPFEAIVISLIFYERGVTGFVSGLIFSFLLALGYFWAYLFSDAIKGKNWSEAAGPPGHDSF
jgi:hypothetical protein